VNPVVYAWGSSASGRLGLVRNAALTIQQQFEDGNETAQLSGPKAIPVYPPSRVEPAWQQEEKEPTQNQQYEIEEPSIEERAQNHMGYKPIHKWIDVQERLWAEDLDQKKKKLEEVSKETAQSMSEVMEEVFRLWDKDPLGYDEFSEYKLRGKEREIECEFVRTLEALHLSNMMPNSKSVKTDSAVLQGLPHFGELLNILQQQPQYLANIAKRLIGKRMQEPKVEIFHRITGGIFENLRDRRTRNLFKALARVMISDEVNRPEVRSLDDLFDPMKSRVSYLITQFCTNPCFLDSIIKEICNPDDDDSLVSIILRYTVTKRELGGQVVLRNPKIKKITGGNHKEEKVPSMNAAPFTGVCASNQAEYEDVIMPDISPEDRTPLKWRRQAFQDELGQFKLLCMGDTANQDSLNSDAEAEGGLIAKFIKKFVERLMGKKTGAKDKEELGMDDLRMLLVCVFTTVVNNRLAVGFKSVAGAGDYFEKDVCSPVAALVLASTIGGVVMKLETSAYALVRLKIREKIRQVEKAAMASYRKVQKNNGLTVEDLEPDTENLEQLVLWNLKAVARIFQRTMHKGMREMQYKAQAQEERELRDCMAHIKEVTNRTLINTLQASVHDRSRHAGEDTTETQLTVDLYITHYSLDRSTVRFSTKELLDITNFLWTMMTRTQRDFKSNDLNLDDLSRDRLYQCLKAIMPKRPSKDDKKEEVIHTWEKDGDIWLAQHHGESHNFTMHARFLEFNRTGLEEPTFCEITQVPVPRSLTKASQKERSGVRVVKPLRLQEDHDLGPKVQLPDDTESEFFAFPELEGLLQDLSENKKYRKSVRYPIGGSSFLDLRAELEFVQKKIAQEIEEGRAPNTMSTLLQRLQKGKYVVDKVRDFSQEMDFYKYIDVALRQRFEYRQYLERIKEGKREITSVRQDYQKSLEDAYQVLSAMASASRDCDLTEDFVSMAQQHSETLTFTRVKRKKIKHRKDKPTPAQKVLETLKDANGGKVTDEALEIAGAPARTFTVKRLMDKGVVVKLNEKIPPHVARRIHFHFQYRDEGYNVRVMIKTTLLKEFFISRQDIMLFEAGRKMAVLPYGGAEPFLWVHCFRLRRLLAWIAADSGL